MFYLKLLGTPALECDGTAITGRAAQRHRLALLSLLAIAPGRRLSRDKLIAYLWPERDAESGRNLLKVATYVLRGSLGENALVTEGDELRLNTGLIEADVAEFDVALKQRDFIRAVSLYKGAFLDGFFLSDAPDFEQWADRERERLAGGFRAALEALAQAAEDAGDYRKAIEWWKQRAAHDPYDSRIALRLMQCLEATGNRAGALQHASVHERLLHAEFNIGLPAEIAELVVRLRREAAVVIATSPRTIDAVPLPESQASSISEFTKRRKWPAFAALAVAVALTGAFFAARPGRADPERSIVVLPFMNLSPEQDVEYFSDGLTEEVIARLAAIPELKVISRTSAMHYKASKLSLPAIARELNVTHVLEGSVRHRDGYVRITAQLITADGDDHLWADNYDYNLHDSFRAQEEIAQEVARALSVELNEPTRKVLAKHGTTDARAYEFYTRGRMFWNLRTREGHELAIQFFERAIERDSNYASAWAGLADAYHTAWQLHLSKLTEEQTYTKATQAAARALELDPQSSDAYTSLATSQLWQNNWPEAARLFQRAIELNPSNASARTWRALTLRVMGRTAEAARESKRAVELDPFSAVAVSNGGWQCYMNRDYDCALREWQRSLEVNPNWPNGHRGVALAYAKKGMLADAIRVLTKAVEVNPHRPDFLADLAYVQALAGESAQARALLTRAKLDPIQGFNIARAHVALGEVDSAFVWFDRSNWHWPPRAMLDDPALDPVRNDPRFVTLSGRVLRDMKVK